MPTDLLPIAPAAPAPPAPVRSAPARPAAASRPASADVGRAGASGFADALHQATTRDSKPSARPKPSSPSTRTAQPDPTDARKPVAAKKETGTAQRPAATNDTAETAATKEAAGGRSTAGRASGRSRKHPDEDDTSSDIAEKKRDGAADAAAPVVIVTVPPVAVSVESAVPADEQLPAAVDSATGTQEASVGPAGSEVPVTTAQQRVQNQAAGELTLQAASDENAQEEAAAVVSGAQQDGTPVPTDARAGRARAHQAEPAAGRPAVDADAVVADVLDKPAKALGDAAKASRSDRPNAPSPGRAATPGDPAAARAAARAAAEQLLNAATPAGAAPSAEQTSTPRTQAQQPSDSTITGPIVSTAQAAAGSARRNERATDASAEEAPAVPAPSVSAIHTASAGNSAGEHGAPDRHHGEPAPTGAARTQASLGLSPTLAAAPAGFVSRLTEAVAASPAAPLTTATAQALAVPDQIIRGMQLQMRDGVGEARIRLTPDHLGEIEVEMKVHGDGVVATLRADTPAVRGWLASHQDDLRAGLADVGLRLDELRVSERDASQQQQREQPDPEQPRRRSRRAPAATGPIFEVHA